MKKLTIAISIVAGIAFSLGGHADSGASGWGSNYHSTGSNNEKKESDLRECVTKCTPSQCKHDRKLAKYCMSVCRGHDMSLPKWLYRKCSMASAGISSSSTAESGQNWDGQGHGSQEPVQYENNQSQALQERGTDAHWQQSTNSNAVQNSGQPSSSNQVGPVARAEPLTPRQAEKLAEGPLNTWQGSSDATLAERTANEAINARNPYGLSDTNVRLYGVDQKGGLLSQSSITPGNSRNYARG